uniref:Germinal-center associated nuclear protein n=1 Tax=Seriola lalandi dorsalis TaxID=1841481 RepID=A0A3B4Y955_SERLL
MNPPNPFGSPQGGAFQAPSNTMKTGLFQTFGQQSSTFGQPSLGMSSSGFGRGAAPAFGQTSGPNQSSVFGQTPAFGQTSAFGQAPGFGQQPSGFGNSQMASGSTTVVGQPQPLGFGQPAFGQPSSTSVTTSAFGTAQSVTQSRAFAPSEFSFKPANEALFKPIFSASPEPANPQTTSITATGFSLLTAPSIPALNNPPTTSNSGGPANTLQFTFSQPAPLSSTKASTTQPTTPSSFSFTAKAPLPQTTSLFGGTNFGQPPPYPETKGQAETSTDEKRSNLEALADTNIFARFGKGTKRKDDPATPSSGPEKPATEEDVSAETDSPRHPPKRPLMRSRGPTGGLFSRALSGLRRDGTNPVRREATKEQGSKWDETGGEDVQGQGDDLTATPPAVQTLTREVLEKAEDTINKELETVTPVKRGVRRESSDSLGGMSPTDCTTIQCRDLPAALNKKDTLMKHFARFGKVSKVLCRPGKNLAIVHFDDHASAAKAKKKGRVLHRHELLLLWQRKKQSKYDLLCCGSLTCVLLCASSPVKKPPLVKGLQSDTEPQKESSTESQSSERPVPSSLLHLIGQLAETAEDKYRLLEQRDKVLRQGRPKRTDLDLSKVFVGTCPDMCPEKERYMRETRNQLSVFEVFPDTEMVDHAAAIKEYSRSSADQEEPLPFELRPLPVLSRTMDYLVTQIMDQGQDNYRDWYDFVWNRTRGIRKDITQQHLCCPHTVSLIEKCTRFHVHCAHHLCEEHMSSFDAKINNENMTKCLQSLKEMYQDLATRQIYCPREAEFRQYNVLLKLNDGDILREVQQFRDDVRNSPEVKFAVHVFTAVNSNNFVRFFKLVKGASYLASCLLHRYFNQVRAKALKTLNIAHTVGPRSTAFPVEDIARMFMFPDIAEATDFIQQYGLNVSDGIVELSRTAYQDPELPLSQKKSEVILAKKTVLVGEVVNGGPLPNPPQHIPVCSFDSQNKYRGEGPQAEPTSSQYKGTVTASPSAELQPQVTSLLDTPSAFVLPPAVPDEPSYSSALPADAQQLFQPISQPQPVKPPSPPAKPRPVYSDEVGTIDAVVHFSLLCHCNTVTVNYKRIFNCICNLFSSLLLCTTRWRDVVAVRRQLKRQMRGFPAAPCCVDPRFKLKALAPSAPAQPSIADLARGLINLGNAGTLALSSTRLLKMRQEAIHQMRVHYYYQQLLEETVWAPLDLPALVAENIPDPPDRVFWKVAVLLPSDHETCPPVFCIRILSDWLEVKLGGDKASELREEQPDGTLQTLCVTNTLQEKGQRTHKVHISVKVRSDYGLSKMEESCELHGTGALIMLLPAMPIVEPGHDEQDVPLLSALLQLKQLQQASTWHCPLPLVVLVPGPDGGTDDTQKLLSQAMRWLLAHAPPPFPLSCQTLVQLVEATLSREFSPRVYTHRQERAAARLPSQDPAPVIQLYNAVLAHVADKVSSQDLCKLSWPPGEFLGSAISHWSKPIIHLLYFLLHSSFLYYLSPSLDSWSELCSSIYHYAAQIPVSRCSQPLLMSRLENLLERVMLKGHRTRTPRSKVTMGNWSSADESVCPAYSRIPWDDVLVICIDHKLKDWQIPGPPACEDAVTEDGEILVYFPTESLKGFQPPEEWSQAINVIRLLDC